MKNRKSYLNIGQIKISFKVKNTEMAATTNLKNVFKKQI